MRTFVANSLEIVPRMWWGVRARFNSLNVPSKAIRGTCILIQQQGGSAALHKYFFLGGKFSFLWFSQ